MRLSASLFGHVAEHERLGHTSLEENSPEKRPRHDFHSQYGPEAVILHALLRLKDEILEDRRRVGLSVRQTCTEKDIPQLPLRSIALDAKVGYPSEDVGLEARGLPALRRFNFEARNLPVRRRVGRRRTERHRTGRDLDRTYVLPTPGKDFVGRVVRNRLDVAGALPDRATEHDPETRLRTDCTVERWQVLEVLRDGQRFGRRGPSGGFAYREVFRLEAGELPESKVHPEGEDLAGIGRDDLSAVNARFRAVRRLLGHCRDRHGEEDQNHANERLVHVSASPNFLQKSADFEPLRLAYLLQSLYREYITKYTKSQ